MEAAVIHPQDIPLGQTVNARRQRLIALWAPEPIPTAARAGFNKSDAVPEEGRP